MRALEELLDPREPALPLLEAWASAADLPIELLPPSADRAAVLHGLQVSTRSTLGAITYETGGILIDGGWLRMLGSGHPKLTRSLPVWNQGRAEGFLLVADDAVGGFFAINGGALGSDPGTIYYLAPDTLDWESLEVGHTAFTQWAFTGRLHDFYSGMRWDGWESDVPGLHGDRCFNFYPFLFTKEGSTRTSSRKAVPVAEQYASTVSAVGRSDS